MLLELKGLNCTRGERRLFRDFSLNIEKGEILQIAGANGSGKTTLMRVVCGLYLAEEVQLAWHGTEVRSALQYADELLYIGHRPALRSSLTVAENLRWFCSLGGQRLDRISLNPLLEQLQLAGYEDEKVTHLSAGQRRRVALARLQLISASLWLLDEPFNALDKAGVALLRSWIAHFVDGGGSVLLTSHQEIEFGAIPVRRIELESRPC